VTQKRKRRAMATSAVVTQVTPSPSETPVGSGEGEPAPEPKEASKMPLFWRVFGGAAVAAVAVVAVAVYTNMQNQISRQRQELTALNKDLRHDMARLAESYAGMIKKEDHTTRMRTAWDTIKELRADRGDLTTMKERCALLLEVYKASEAEGRSLAAEVRRLRESKTAADERDQLVREIRALRERLAQLESRPNKARTIPAAHEQEKR
jgi:outer membrane murein-binding lipoprotein Lpp